MAQGPVSEKASRKGAKTQRRKEGRQLSIDWLFATLVPLRVFAPLPETDLLWRQYDWLQ